MLVFETTHDRSSQLGTLPAKQVAEAMNVSIKSVTRTIIVEDDAEFLQRFADTVSAQSDFELVAAVADGASAMQSLEGDAPDMLLIDLGLPDMSGIDIIRATARRHPSTDIMVVSVFGDERHVLASIEAGATGYVLKDCQPEELIDLMRKLRDGGSPISPVVARQLIKKLQPTPAPAADEPRRLGLSSRECEILSLIAKGFSFGEVARLLQISPHTVPTYVKKIYQKLAVHSRSEAVYEAHKLGIIKL